MGDELGHADADGRFCSGCLLTVAGTPGTGSTSSAKAGMKAVFVVPMRLTQVPTDRQRCRKGLYKEGPGGGLQPELSEEK
mmetsp:Transcript_87319/g.203139  ORF Transcript_87319/g.203139 Transcript_87319/m.203139 type:complete len:80 (+) Transcript_87319:109-348(+)